MARKRNRVKSKHIRFAHSLKYEKDAEFFEGKTAEQLVDSGFAEIESLGYHIVQRKLIKPTTTMAIILYLGKGFADRSPSSKASTIWHELVHAYQWRDVRNIFPLRYLNRRWQWAFETQGYRQQCRVIRALHGDKAARKFAFHVPGRMQKKPYTMRRLDAAHVRRETLRAFEVGLPGLELCNV